MLPSARNWLRPLVSYRVLTGHLPVRLQWLHRCVASPPTPENLPRPPHFWQLVFLPQTSHRGFATVTTSLWMDCQRTITLPTPASYRFSKKHVLVAGVGIEPTTSGLWVPCSNQLSYPASHSNIISLYCCLKSLLPSVVLRYLSRLWLSDFKK